MILFRSLTLAYFKSFTQPQTWRFGPSDGFFFLTGKNAVHPELGRNACLAAEQPIYDPVDGSWVPIGARTEPFHVLARSSAGRVVIAEATRPFVRGYDDILRVTLSNGLSILATPAHLVLSPTGWVEVRDLRVGQELLSGDFSTQQLLQSDVAHQHSIGDTFLAGSPVSESHCLGKGLNCRDHYSDDCRRCGAPLLLELRCGIECLLQSNDVRKYTQIYGLRGDLASEVANPLSDRVALPVSSSRFGASGHPSISGRIQGVSEIFEQTQVLDDGRHRTGLSAQAVAQSRPSFAHHQSRNRSLFLSATNSEASLTSVVSIEFVRKDLFYDTHVPIYNNYWAAGIWNHNCGKSSLLDGLVWTLYGRTARGQRAGDVVNWDADGAVTEGSVAFLAGEHYYRLTRTQSPNSLTIERKGHKPRTTTQPEIDQLIGLTYDEFLAVVMMGQFNRFFFDLSPSDKLQQFGAVLGLEYWSGKARQAATLADRYERKYVELDRELEGLRERIRVLGEELQIAQKEERELQREREGKLEQLRREFGKLKAEISKVDLRLSVVEAETGNAEKWLEEQRTSIEAVERDLKEHRQKLSVLEADEATARLGRDAAEQVLKDSYKDKCPSCGAPVKDRERRIAEATTAVRQSRDHWLKVERDRNRLRSEVSSIEEGLRSLRRQFESHQSATADFKSQRTGLEVALKNLQDRKAECRERYRALRDGKGSAPSRAGKIAVALREAKQSLSQRGRLLPFFAARRHGGEYWAKGFRDLRLWLVAEALKQLEVEVGNSLLALGLRGWRVTFDIERATKSGGVSRGFNVFIHPPGQDQPVRWESFSGGETQRLRVAGAIGLANLIRDRRGFDCNLEFWDEPTAGLSGEGIDDLLSFFQSRSRDEGRQIWLIDHRALAYDFDGEVCVTKKPTGSVISGGRWSHGKAR